LTGKKAIKREEPPEEKNRREDKKKLFIEILKRKKGSLKGLVS
jgi:hypothetical protein